MTIPPAPSAPHHPPAPFHLSLLWAAQRDVNVPEVILTPSFSIKTISKHQVCHMSIVLITLRQSQHYQGLGLVSFCAFCSCCCCPQVQEGL